MRGRFLLSGVSTGLAIVLRLVLSVLLVRALGMQLFGVYQLGLGVATVAAVLVGWGAPAAVLQLMNRSDASNSDRQLCFNSGVQWLIFVTAAWSGACLFFIGFGGASFLFNDLGAMVLVLCAPLLFGELLLGQIFMYSAMVHEYHFVKGFFSAFAQFCLVCLLVYFEVDSLFAYAGAYMISLAIVLVALSWRVCKLSELHAKFHWSNLKESLRVTKIGSFLVVNGVVWQLLAWLDHFMIKYYLGDSSVGEYGVIYRLSVYSGVMLTVIGSYYPSIIAKRRNEIGPESAIVVYGESMRLLVVASMPIFLATVFWGDVILSVLFDVSDPELVLSMRILAFAFFINAVLGQSGVICNVLGGFRYLFCVNLLCLAVNCILNILLIPHVGLLGASIATLASFVVLKMLHWIIVARILGGMVFPARGIELGGFFALSFFANLGALLYLDSIFARVCIFSLTLLTIAGALTFSEIFRKLMSRK